MNRSALVVGATGLVGNELVNLLLESDEYTSVTILVRRDVNLQHPKLTVKIIDFDQVDEAINEYYDDVFCCLGTTIKKAKTKENFQKVDLAYPLNIAQKAKEQGLGQFLVISSLGANTSSPFFYSRVKGELEKGLIELDLPSLKIFRPSLLVGQRPEVRLGEKSGEIAGKLFRPFLIGPMRKYRSNKGEKVAERMYEAALHPTSTSVTVYESSDLQ
ncbi:NAD(P)H-binding protein [Bacillus spongiae]|uniref:NAD(P)H-binding protein n=1 Tax=Bacillus spongiae TaxID=2683610 RepID=A0ABU8HKI1_9BACI